MPHDKNNNVLAVGDSVIIRAKITSIQMGEEYCNLSAETDEKMYPGENKSTMTLNAKQVEKVGENGLPFGGPV